MLHILAAVAEFERELIRERVSAGMRNAKSKAPAAARRLADHAGFLTVRKF